MQTLNRDINGSFVINESKLTRLITVVRDQLGRTNNQEGVHEKYEVHMAGDRTLQTTQLAEVLALDNTQRNRIVRVVTECEAGVARVVIIFGGQAPPDISIAVSDNDARSLHETMSTVEEQVERTSQTTLMHRL